jgi:5S rRNA maturation endonuclease (ribonuclease M5)
VLKNPRPAPITHFVDWDTRGRRLRRAICGRLIHVSDEAIYPSCTECRRELERRALEDRP